MHEWFSRASSKTKAGLKSIPQGISESGQVVDTNSTGTDKVGMLEPTHSITPVTCETAWTWSVKHSKTLERLQFCRVPFNLDNLGKKWEEHGEQIEDIPSHLYSLHLPIISHHLPEFYPCPTMSNFQWGVRTLGIYGDPGLRPWDPAHLAHLAQAAVGCDAQKRQGVLYAMPPAALDILDQSVENLALCRLHLMFSPKGLIKLIKLISQNVGGISSHESPRSREVQLGVNHQRWYHGAFLYFLSLAKWLRNGAIEISHCCGCAVQVELLQLEPLGCAERVEKHAPKRSKKGRAFFKGHSAGPAVKLSA